MDVTKLNDRWRLIRIPVREAIVVVVVSALAISVFLGVIQAMAPDNSSQAESAPQSTETTPSAVNVPATNSAEGPESPSPG
jgi:Na+/H+-dicarboxylate symporter